MQGNKIDESGIAYIQNGAPQDQDTLNRPVQDLIEQLSEFEFQSEITEEKGIGVQAEKKIISQNALTSFLSGWGDEDLPSQPNGQNTMKNGIYQATGLFDASVTGAAGALMVIASDADTAKCKQLVLGDGKLSYRYCTALVSGVPNWSQFKEIRFKGDSDASDVELFLNDSPFMGQFEVFSPSDYIYMSIDQIKFFGWYFDAVAYKIGIGYQTSGVVRASQPSIQPEALFLGKPIYVSNAVAGRCFFGVSTNNASSIYKATISGSNVIFTKVTGLDAYGVSQILTAPISGYQIAVRLDGGLATSTTGNWSLVQSSGIGNVHTCVVTVEYNDTEYEHLVQIRADGLYAKRVNTGTFYKIYNRSFTEKDYIVSGGGWPGANITIIRENSDTYWNANIDAVSATTIELMDGLDTHYLDGNVSSVILTSDLSLGQIRGQNEDNILSEPAVQVHTADFEGGQIQIARGRDKYKFKLNAAQPWSSELELPENWKLPQPTQAFNILRIKTSRANTPLHQKKLGYDNYPEAFIGGSITVKM